MFMSRYNLVMEDYSSLKRGKLFYGTSAIAITNKELPTRYTQIEKGMKVMLTNKFGGLAALSLHTLSLLDPANETKFEQAGVSISELTKAKDEALKSLSEPHFALGKVISKYCPDFGQAYDRSAHVTAVFPVGARGIFALGQLAELANAKIEIENIPLRYKEISALATREALVENATSSQSGCHLVVGTKDVLSLISEELRQHHFEPEIIGTVTAKEDAVSAASAVVIQNKDELSQYVAHKAKLARLLKPTTI
jgi:selenophosphate synthase